MPDSNTRIINDIASCTACTLAQLRLSTVPHCGNENADVFLIGEAPGEQEDKEGIPFIGPSGQHLRSTLANNGIDVETLFITNILKCRPPNNRRPTATEKMRCCSFLRRQLDLVKPSLIVTLGITAYQAFLTEGKPMGRLQMAWLGLNRYQLFPLLHPAAGLYRPQLLPIFEANITKLAEVICSL